MKAQPTERIFSRQYTRRPLQLEREIGVGGEGQVYSVSGSRLLAAKLYHHPSKQHMMKLSMMLMHPPPIPEQRQGKIVWPLDGIMDEDDQYVGFLMPLIDKQRNVTLAQIYHPEARRNTAKNFTWKSLLSIAANIAEILATLHAANYVIGDLNESNILINIQTGDVHLIDCDSMQVPAPNNQMFRCLVGKPEYTPPELHKVSFDRVDRLPEHDNFALAILIFLLLMEGVHPFTGSRPNADDVPLPSDNIQQKQWPYALNTELRPPRYALPLNILPLELQELMQRCFLHGSQNPQQRPTASAWLAALEDAQTQVTHCHQNKQHWYSKHLTDCPWCKRQQQLKFDSFSPAPATPKTARKKNVWPVHPRARRTTPKARVTGLTSLKSRVAYFIISVIVVFFIGTAINSRFPNSTTTTPIINPALQPINPAIQPITNPITLCLPGETSQPPNCYPRPTIVIPSIIVPPLKVVPIPTRTSK